MSKSIQVLLLAVIFAGNLFSQCGEGLDITLSTQSEVEEFIEDYCTNFRGHLRIIDNQDGIDNIIDLNPLLGLNSVYGVFEIRDNNIFNLKGLDSLKSVGAIRIFSNQNIKNLLGLENLKFTIGDFWVSGNEKLLTLSGIKKLYQVGGSIIIGLNDQLLQVDALSTVLLASKILIYKNPVIRSLNGISNITASSIRDNPINVKEISIYNNSSLSDCSNKFLCEVLLRDDIEFKIEENLENCNSAEEILSVCLTSIDEENPKLKIKIYPNPSTSEFHIKSSKALNVNLFDMNGQLVKEFILIDGMNTIDVESLNSGVYILRGKQIYQKLLKL